MRTVPRPASLGRLLLVLVVVTSAELRWADSAWPSDGQHRVLVLHATRRDAQIVALSERELPRILESAPAGSLDYYSEYIDQTRFPDPDTQAAFRDYFRVKYRALNIDVVIAMHDSTLGFVAENRDLFPDTPVVFFATSAATRRITNSTGLVAAFDFSGSLAFAAELQPAARRVFVVSGADNSDRIYEKLARAQFRSFEPRFAFTYLSGLPTEELEARLARLPADSIVYYLLVNRDGAGRVVHPLEYLDRVTTVAGAPVYSWVDSAMGRGIVGGSLKSQARQTEAIGQLALRILLGEPADGIPISSPDLNVTQVDWRQLLRWGISEARLPPGTVVQFREPSAWDRYRVYILAAIAVLLTQTALIAGLLIQRRRRQQAEEHVRGSEVALRTSFERIRALGTRLLSAQEAERSRIARELHDDIGQQMALLTIELELLARGRHGPGDEVAGEALSRVQGIARSVHELSHRLHPARLRLIGLVPALNALRRELSQADVAITFAHDKVPPALPLDLTLCLYRIVQEGLQNAIKYSRAREVSVRLNGGPDGLALAIADDGVGFDVDAAWGRGLGLVSMAERLDAIGGTFEIRSRPGAGTRIEVKVPQTALRLRQQAAG